MFRNKILKVFHFQKRLNNFIQRKWTNLKRTRSSRSSSMFKNFWNKTVAWNINSSLRKFERSKEILMGIIKIINMDNFCLLVWIIKFQRKNKLTKKLPKSVFKILSIIVMFFRSIWIPIKIENRNLKRFSKSSTFMSFKKLYNCTTILWVKSRISNKSQKLNKSLREFLRNWNTFSKSLINKSVIF